MDLNDYFLQSLFLYGSSLTIKIIICVKKAENVRWQRRAVSFADKVYLLVCIG